MFFLITNFFPVSWFLLSLVCFAFASLCCFMRNHRCKSRQMIGGAKEFCLDSPKLAQKILDLQKNALHVNLGAIIFKSKHVGRHFCSDFWEVLEGSQRFCPDFRRIFPVFMGFCPDFDQIKTFGGAVAPPAPPPTPVWETSFNTEVDNYHTIILYNLRFAYFPPAFTFKTLPRVVSIAALTLVGSGRRSIVVATWALNVSWHYIEIAKPVEHNWTYRLERCVKQWLRVITREHYEFDGCCDRRLLRWS